jgi:hypothetical protein
MFELIVAFAAFVAFLLINQNPNYDGFRSLAGLMCFAFGLTMVIGGAGALLQGSAQDSPPMLLFMAMGGFVLWCGKRLWTKIKKPDPGHAKEAKQARGKPPKAS